MALRDAELLERCRPPCTRDCKGFHVEIQHFTQCAAIAAAVNASAAIDPLSGLAVNALVTAALDAVVKSKVVFTLNNPTIGAALAATLTTTSYLASRAVSPFADNGYGVIFADTSQKLLVHEPFLCAACNLYLFPPSDGKLSHQQVGGKAIAHSATHRRRRYGSTGTATQAQVPQFRFERL